MEQEARASLNGFSRRLTQGDFANLVIAEKLPATIPVVDDDELIRKLFKTALAQENYEPMFAASGIEALNLMRKRRPDLILMDMMMSDIDGIETIRRIKSAEQLFTIPIIMGELSLSGFNISLYRRTHQMMVAPTKSNDCRSSAHHAKTAMKSD